MTVLSSGSATDVGRVRSINEDLAFESNSLFAVADGMGGHAGGEVAARTAIDSLRSGFEHSPSVEGLLEAVHEANEAVWERGRAEPALRGMGTTLTTAALVGTDEGDRLVLANVGDSRAYRLHDGQLSQLTVDHSVAEELVARGELSESEAMVHPHRHILTRALGVDPDVEVDTWELVPEEGDRYLLCSDGLSNEVSTEKIAEVLTTKRDPNEAAETLVAMANDHGGNDNVTALVLDVLVGEGSVDGKGDAIPGAAKLQDGSAAGPSVSTAADAATSAADAPPATAAPSAGPAPAAPAATGTQGGGTAVMARTDSPTAADTASRPSVREPAPPRRSAPRRVTFRVLLFLVLLGGLAYGAYSAVRWYVNSSYFVGVDRGEVVVFQGRIGGFIGFNPKVIDRTGITLSQVKSSDVGKTVVAPRLQSGISESSRSQAINYVCNLAAVAPGTPEPKLPKHTRCPGTPSGVPTAMRAATSTRAAKA